MIHREYNVFTMCSGLGGGAAGYQEAISTVGVATATWRCIGGIDNDPAACRDFKTLVGVDCTLMDLFTREQYTAFFGCEPSAGWKEATPDDIRRAASNEHPHCVFISSPCKGASGLLSQTLSLTPKYQALNELTLRCVWLMCEAWKDDPVELIVFENVPRLATRGRHLLDQIDQILHHYGYAANDTTHDCGEIGELAQSRKRYLKVARHMAKVPAFLYEPPLRRLQGVGTVLGRMPLPGDPAGGPMHRVPSLQWKTWVRLAFVEAGSDWRSLNNLAVEDGHLRDFLIMPERRNGYLGVHRWGDTAGAVAGESLPTNGAFSVADVRFSQSQKWNYGQAYGVLGYGDSAGAIAGQQSPGQGYYTVADPRHLGAPKHNNEFRIVHWDRSANAVTGAHGTGQCVADPRTTMRRERGDNYLTGGHYGVVGWEQSSGAVSAAACHDNGRWSVADPRMPARNQKLIAVIHARDGTWHRPFTTFELACLQSLVEPEGYLELDGLSDQAWRERIGNAVPKKAARAIAQVMGTTLLLAETGETFMLSSTPVWVRNIAIALSVARGDIA